MYDEGFGWPECYKRRRRNRIVREKPEAVGALLDAIARFPNHHRLIAVFELPDVEWREVDDVSVFPVVPREEDEDDG